MNRGLLSNTTSLWILGIGFCMFCYNIDTFYNRPIFFYKYFQNSSSFPPIFSGIYIYGIPFFYMQLAHCLNSYIITVLLEPMKLFSY